MIELLTASNVSEDETLIRPNAMISSLPNVTQVSERNAFIITPHDFRPASSKIATSQSLQKTHIVSLRCSGVSGTIS